MITRKGETDALLASFSTDKAGAVLQESPFGLPGHLVQQEITFSDCPAAGRQVSLRSPNVSLTYTLAHVPGQEEDTFSHGTGLVQLCFCLRGTVHYIRAGEERPAANLQEQQHNVFLFPAGAMASEKHATAECEVFELSLTPDFFFRCLPPAHVLVSQFLRKQAENKFDQLLPMIITPRLTAILYELLNQKLKGFCWQTFFEAKVMELLAYQLEQWEQTLELDAGENLKKEDEQKMQLAREILLADLEHTISIKELAHQIGTNEFDLKKHFKMTFGETVFGYRQAYKMERARELLLQGDTKINEISRLLGYKHATHFTSAFKRHFGLLPNKIKK
ncbi:AraC family transcriptional regulator [Rufibacter sp. LB8]|uniref:helix-turn-helix transcriptional regulator n=1 Tax=Rufibacter sp. LB8 TaxID=2777781 RepID=UPI00178C7C7A|nr:AraC family transcriptional regulator [Rufibacter sp. LB8]